MENIENLLTPNQVASNGFMSLVKQWELRKSGKLNFYKIGKKILYSQAHIEAYLKSVEQQNKNEDLVNAK